MSIRFHRAGDQHQSPNSHRALIGTRCSTPQAHSRVLPMWFVIRI